MGTTSATTSRALNVRAKLGLVTVLTLLMTIFIGQGGWYSPTPVHATITTVNGNSWSSVYAGAAFPGTYLYTVSPGSGHNRMLVVAVSTTISAVSATQTCSVRYGGQALTEQTSNKTASTQQHTYLFYLKEAGLDTATDSNLVVTVTGGTSRYNYVYATVLDGVDQSGTPISGQQSATGTTAVALPSLTVGANEQAVEIVNLTRTGGTTARTLTNAANWTFPLGPNSYSDTTNNMAFSAYAAVDTTAAATTASHTPSSTISLITAMSAMSVKAAAVVIPTVSSTSPSSGGQGATSQDITINGNGFFPGSVVSFSGTAGQIIVNSTTYVSATQLTANITVSAAATTGARNVTVTNYDAGVGTGTGVFTVNAKPTVTSTTPNSLFLGSTNQDVTVTGTGFVNGAAAVFSGTGITVNSTTFVSATSLTANISIDSAATTGARNVTVTNPDAGVGTGTGVFTVASPTLTVGAGTNPASANAYVNSTNNAIDGFTMVVNSGTGQVNTLTLTNTNSAATNVSNITIYRDTGTVGTLDVSDTFVPTTFSITSATAATVTFTTPETVTTSSQNYLIVYDIASTATVGNTMTSRVTAATGTGLGTPTYSDAGSGTLTVATGTLTVGAGTNPANANAYVNSTNNAIDGFTMVVSAGTGKVSTLTLTNTNSAATNVSNITIYRDTGTVGTLDVSDTFVPTTFSITSATAATVTFTTPETVTTSSQNYLIVYDIASTATVGNTMTSRVTAATGTGLGTPTYSDSGSGTLTVATSNLTIGDGSSPLSITAYKGNTYAIDGFSLVVDVGVGQVTGLTLTNTNSVATNVSSIKVYLDDGDTPGTLSSSNTLVPTTFSITSATAATITFTTAQTISATAQNYLIAFTINSTAAAVTLTSKVTNASGSGLGTIVKNDTASATLTTDTNNLTIANGTDPASNANVYSGVSYAIDGFTMVMSAVPATVSTLTLTNTGTGSMDTHVSGITVYRDAGTIGTLDSADTPIPTSFSISGNVATITFTTPETVPITSPNKYLVVLTISDSAVNNNTLIVKVTGATGYVGVPTYSDTASATLTVDVGTLTIGSGSAITNANVPQGTTGSSIDSFSMVLSSLFGRVDTLTLTKNAQFTAGNVTSIKVYSDAGTIGTLDGADTLIPTTYSIGTSTATILFDPQEQLTNVAKNYLIVIDVAPSAKVGNTLAANVTNASGIGFTSTNSNTTPTTHTVTTGVCARSTPALSLTAYGQVKPNDQTTYDISITNNDSIFCDNTTFDLAVGSETGTTSSFTIPSTLGAATTGAMPPAATFSTTLTVTATASAIVADALTTTVNVTDATNHAGQPASINVKTYANNPLLHNSISMTLNNSNKWTSTGWGIPGGKYGAFDCTTCHTPKTSNIFRVKPSITAPSENFPGTDSTVNFQSKTTPNGFGVYSTTVSNSQQICERCHSLTLYHKNTMPTVISHENEAQTRDCTMCHKHENGFKAIGGCTKCHARPQRGRAAIFGQFSTGNSHHIQGVPVTDTLCYQCHWEANSDGTVNLTYHVGSVSSQQPVNLVVYQNGVRPTSNNASTAVLYTANGSRTEIAKLNNVCLGCHNAGSGNAQPFGDGKTPKKYAWDGLSIYERYLQPDTTPWGKYNDTATTNVNPKDKQKKAYSAHGRAALNDHGSNTNETWPDTSGVANVLCFDCHNSHGSTVTGVTSNYSSATGRNRGAILKDTIAGRGGYSVTYKPQAGGSAATKDAYNPGAGICFDCHNSINTTAQPWSYQATYGASQAILGYWDTPYFSNGTFQSTQRYPYKAGNASNKGGHLGKSSAMNTTPAGSINGLCTPCHDPHGVSPTLGVNQQYAVPLLKGTWLTSPYPEDAAPALTNEKRGGATSRGPGAINVGSTPGYHIDQNTLAADTGNNSNGPAWNFANTTNRVTQTDTQFAGLCLQCHTKAAIGPGTSANTTATWKSMDRIHNTVKGWGTIGGNAANAAHSFVCSKCHTPHNSRLPRLMVTNCLDFKHRGRVASGKTFGSGAQSGSRGAGGGRGPMGGGGSGSNADWPGPWFFAPASPAQSTTSNIRTCHNVANAGGTGTAAANQLWNTRTPW